MSKQTLTVVLTAIVIFPLGLVAGFALGVYSTDFGKKLMEVATSNEGPADVAHSKTITRDHFELKYPGNWMLARDDEHFDIDRYFSIDTPGHSYVFPNVEHAVVESQKLSDYLLNLSHPVAGPKAKWFISLGFSREEPEILAQRLLELAQRSDDYSVIETSFGVKYVVQGLLVTPNGTSTMVRTVWIVESGSDVPRLATAYPGIQE
jgi:hypothetical protein